MKEQIRLLQSEIEDWEQRFKTEENMRQLIVEQAEELEKEIVKLQLERNHIEILYKEKSEECNSLIKELSDLTNTDWSLQKEEKKASEHLSEMGGAQDQVISSLHEKLDQILMASQAGLKQRNEEQRHENERLQELNR